MILRADGCHGGSYAQQSDACSRIANLFLCTESRTYYLRGIADGFASQGGPLLCGSFRPRNAEIIYIG